jgi:hypothetical protein
MWVMQNDIRIMAAMSYRSDLHHFYHYTQFHNIIVDALHNPEVLGLNHGKGQVILNVFIAIFDLLISPSQYQYITWK